MMQIFLNCGQATGSQKGIKNMEKFAVPSLIFQDRISLVITELTVLQAHSEQNSTTWAKQSSFSKNENRSNFFVHKKLHHFHLCG